MNESKVILVGESNPYGADPYYALYPCPDGCAGHRLCRLVLNMTRCTYLAAFERVNLCAGKWSIKEARARAEEIGYLNDRVVLLGSKVSAAFGVAFEPFTIKRQSDTGQALAILPHPSGLCRLWNEPQAFERARLTVYQLAPELEGVSA